MTKIWGDGLPIARMDKLLDRLAYGIAALFVVFLLLFGWKFHPIEIVGGPENDNYVAKADEFRHGRIPVDTFRPLLYPLLSAGVGTILDDTFAGARLVSGVAAGLFALLTYLLGRTCFNRQVGLLALLGIVTNYTVINGGVVAATDMLFSAFVALVLLFACRLEGEWRYRTVVALGLFFAFAYFTRYTAIALIPTVIFALTYGRSLRDKRTRYGLLIFFAAATVFLLPHFALTIKVFGNPFFNENWENLAFKLYGAGDWTYYSRIPFDGLSSVILADPERVIASAAKELYRLLAFQFVRVSGNSNMTWTGTLLMTFFALGLLGSLFALDKKKIVLLSFLAVYAGMVCFFYEWRTRLVLPVLPIFFVFAAYFVVNVPALWRAQAGWERSRLGIAVGAIFLALHGAALARELHHFVDRHPLAELEAARELENRYGPGMSVMSAFPQLPRYVNFKFSYLPDAVGQERQNKELYFEKLKAAVDSMKPEYLIIGRVSLARRPNELLLGTDLPPFLIPVSINRDTAVYRVKWSDKSVGGAQEIPHAVVKTE